MMQQDVQPETLKTGENESQIPNDTTEVSNGENGVTHLIQRKKGTILSVLLSEFYQIRLYLCQYFSLPDILLKFNAFNRIIMRFSTKNNEIFFIHLRRLWALKLQLHYPGMQSTFIATRLKI
jgi:hypothetical protein